MSIFVQAKLPNFSQEVSTLIWEREKKGRRETMKYGNGNLDVLAQTLTYG